MSKSCIIFFVLSLFIFYRCADKEEVLNEVNIGPIIVEENSYTNSLFLKWIELSGAAKYQIRYSIEEDMINVNNVETEKESIILENLKKDTKYFYQIRAMFNSEWTYWSKVHDVNTAAFEASITTYNVLSSGADSQVEPEFAWALRKEAFKSIVFQDNNNPDIIAFQETIYNGIEIQNMIKERYDSHYSKREVSPRLISWKPEKFKLVSFNNDIDIFGAEVEGGNTARYLTCVRLQEIETGKEILVYSLHIPQSSNKSKEEGQRIRSIAAKNIAFHVKRESNATGLPAIVLGDFNNYANTVISGIKSAPMVMRESGFIDTFDDALIRTNEDYMTMVDRSNSTARIGENGSKRLDYIFTYPEEAVSTTDYSIIINFQKASIARLQTPVPSDHHPVRSILNFTYY